MSDDKRHFPKRNGKTEQLSVRLSHDTLERLDAFREEQLVTPTRTQAIRHLLDAALAPYGGGARLVPAETWDCPECGVHMTGWRKGEPRPSHQCIAPEFR